MRFPSKQVPRAVPTLSSGLRREATLTCCTHCYDLSFMLRCLHFPDLLKASSPTSVLQPAPRLGGKATCRPCPTARVLSRSHFVTSLSPRQNSAKFVKTEEHKTRPYVNGDHSAPDRISLAMHTDNWSVPYTELGRNPLGKKKSSHD